MKTPLEKAKRTCENVVQLRNKKIEIVINKHLRTKELILYKIDKKKLRLTLNRSNAPK